ncbi:unnamed protein product [Lepeophtheirus salmonis]|uniref:(salmon louse) hypothetical protein n=1 Tax=Lepeophtheirus salmonis TaxID=72036 RepID=A0A7R8CF54_LEPSM|nr:unnamed protein product [Lepeophtheirus salmonis]CAF2803161.1 unnamed protein product [Lepeophtheirus salmonis]
MWEKKKRNPHGSRVNNSESQTIILKTSSWVPKKLFVENEKASLRDLNERVKKASQDLALSAWTARAQRVNLDELLLKAGDPSSSVLRANLHHEILYTEFLKKRFDKNHPNSWVKFFGFINLLLRKYSPPNYF